MSKTFWFSDENKNLISKEFEHVDGRDIYLDAEGYAEENGLHFFHPNVYQSREQVEKRAKEYAKKVINFKEKITSPATKQMKEEAKAIYFG